MSDSPTMSGLEASDRFVDRASFDRSVEKLRVRYAGTGMQVIVGLSGYEGGRRLQAETPRKPDSLVHQIPPQAASR